MPVLEAKSCSNQTYPVILVLETKPKDSFGNIWKPNACDPENRKLTIDKQPK
jgi:hypothetical protein